MNSEKNLLKRLIRLYPVKIVKEHFDNDQNADTLADDITQKHSSKAIQQFAFNNLHRTKQHIYIYELNKNWVDKSVDPTKFPLPIVKQNYDDGELTITCSILVDFKVGLLEDDEFSTDKIQFRQPINIVVDRKKLVVHMTIVEKDINSHFDPGIKVVQSTRVNSEEATLQKIEDFFHPTHSVSICDINKGVKKLWDEGDIDSKYVQYKSSRSTTTESMDENYTVREQYPDIYKNIVKAPLNKTVFKNKREDELLVDRFTADPSRGQLSIAIFPSTDNQIQNVIDKILSNN